MKKLIILLGIFLFISCKKETTWIIDLKDGTSDTIQVIDYYEDSEFLRLELDDTTRVIYEIKDIQRKTRD